MDVFNTVGNIASTIVSVVAVVTLLFSPVRVKLKELIINTSESEDLKKSIRDTNVKIDTIIDRLQAIQSELDIQKGANRSLLRSEITKTYYKNLDSGTLREYEAQALERNYESYKKEDGNSFVDRIYKEMEEWKIVL